MKPGGQAQPVQMKFVLRMLKLHVSKNGGFGAPSEKNLLTTPGRSSDSALHLVSHRTFD